jgi:hypothetical protein
VAAKIRKRRPFKKIKAMFLIQKLKEEEGWQVEDGRWQ